MFETRHFHAAWLVHLAALSGIALSPGCSALIDVDGHQCQTDTDCTQNNLGATCQSNVCVPAPDTSSTANGAASTDTLSCTGDADCSGDAPRCLVATDVCVSDELAQQFSCPLPAPAEAAATVRFSFNVRLFVERANAPANLVVKACEVGDLKCMAPMKMFTDTEKTGAVELDLPPGVPVYFEITSEGLPVLVYFSLIPETDVTLTRNILVPTQEVIAALTATLNIPFSIENGITLIELEDCTGRTAAGVHVTQNPPSGDSFYFKSDQPFRNEVVTTTDDVYDHAYGGFSNVTPGGVDFSAYAGESGPLLRSLAAQVRANTVTYVELDTRTR